MKKDKTLKEITVEIQKEWYSETQCVENPHKLYIFGDNLIRRGKGGQAIIRDFPNAWGIATKRLPSMSNNSFFGDRPDEMTALITDIAMLINMLLHKDTDFNTLVFPEDGLGTGLSKMPSKSPKLFKWLNETISFIFNIHFNPNIH